jgi:hypothetical protein
MAASDPACPSCGMGKPQPRARAGSDDALQYVKIIGIMVVVIVVVLIVAGMMGPSAQPCGACKGKKTLACLNCQSGRNLCKNCKGHGFDPQTFSTCPDCKGKGDTPACWMCGGKPNKACPTCKGTGLHPE